MLAAAWVDGQFWAIVVRSLYVSGTAVLVSAALGIPVGLWAGLSRFRAKPLLIAVVHTGMALPPVLVGLLLYMLLSRAGPLGGLGWLFTPQAMILAQTVLALPFVIGITMGGVGSIPGELVPQLAGLGASPTQVRRTILWETRRAILLAVAAAFGRSISEVGAVLIVGGNIQGHTRVLTTAIVLETSRGQFGLALLLGAVLMALALSVNFAMLRLHRDGRVV